MDVEKYRDKWGGEDWDLLDRILRIGLESERMKVAGFYHYYHTKGGMWHRNPKWDIATIKVPASGSGVSQDAQIQI